jgi:hypothetical protein
VSQINQEKKIEIQIEKVTQSYSYQTLVANCILGGSKGYPSAKRKPTIDTKQVIATPTSSFFIPNTTTN